MRILRSLNNCSFNEPILTIGTYDGVHLGHQSIIREMVARARAAGKESVLMTFEPHPRMVLQPLDHQVELIDTLDEKLAKLDGLGLDTVILYPFSIDFARLSATDFIEQILVKALGVSEVHVGYDHQFGKNREGTYELLVQKGKEFGYSVTQIEARSIQGVAISSTKIRQAIRKGDVETAEHYLGRSHALSGTVIHGNKLGRTIGFPTANIDWKDSTKLLPENGVYAVRVEVKNTWFEGVMNIGVKPTVQKLPKLTAEVFIFDFDQDIYNELIKVEFVKHLRGEQKFDSVESLKNQLKKDEELARSVFSSRVVRD
ncbi:MAG: bifunctional riboflavin kinase/FAD synthetase [Fluviicola sp.]